MRRDRTASCWQPTCSVVLTRDNSSPSPT